MSQDEHTDKIKMSQSMYEVQYDIVLVAPEMLTLEDFTGNSMGKVQRDCIYNQKIAGFTDIMEERYNYTVMNVDSEISYKDYTQWYEPSESYFKKDVSFWTRMAQIVWSATGVGGWGYGELGSECEEIQGCV